MSDNQPIYDLNVIGTPAALARQIKADIDDYCKRAYDDGFRSHLGASVIGHECARYIWYSFRWAFVSNFSGRMLRLFNRGHREEARFIEWLTGIGCIVSDTQADGKTQHRISDVEGHFGGSLDAGIALAARYRIVQNVVLGEFKTQKGGSDFTNMMDPNKGGMRKWKPRHYAQMCVYGKKKGLEWGLYMAGCKQDDELHIEIVKLDWAYGEDLIRKGETIITSPTPPRRIAANASFKTCKLCDARPLCWENAPVSVNCRSCRFARPITEAQWYCDGWQQTIPKDFLKQGCPNHQSIPT